MPSPKAFKVKVKFQNDAHPPLTIGVDHNAAIRTVKDAEEHVRRVIHHKDEAGNIWPVVEAKAEGPFDIEQVPVVRSLDDAVKAEPVADEAADELPAEPQ